MGPSGNKRTLIDTQTICVGPNDPTLLLYLNEAVPTNQPRETEEFTGQD